MKLFQQGIAVILSWSLVLAGVQASVQDGFAQAPAQALQQSPQQLQQLVAPIALYPDRLVAQILAAASYPDQIVEAENWLEKHKNLTGEKLGKEVNKQHWDASVKALTQFPAVLANMSQNLAWTSELGDAYVNQQQALNQALQTMRQKAKQAGNLKTTPQENVTTQGQTIVIQPAAPDVVYVPQYDPWLVYGYPLAVFPGWYPYPGLFLGGPGIAFGLGFGIGLFAGFGWVGAIGDMTGAVAAGWFTTTTPTSRIAGRSSIAVTFVRRASAVPPILAAATLARAAATLAGVAATLARVARVPAPSAGSIMADLRGRIRSEGAPALGASMEGASEEAEASTAEGAGDRSH
jgi:hypothetical protein